ncbi:hypothetical protein DPMN_064774 [Dreissena polymorpha]|uniref:Uncharacterized protein n=1 Tax=Dreissena polymorpha TaxID=45954 RepID=A0A9D4CCU7_DREPO|nr:hypothetical protein DPMN_064774 [Dreissena polymorpha]
MVVFHPASLDYPGTQIPKRCLAGPKVPQPDITWETLEAFLKFPVPRPGFEPETFGMVDQSVTTRPPHYP